MTVQGNGWEDWSKFVIFSINKMWEKMDSIEKNLNKTKMDIQRDIVTLQVKSYIWGSIGGVIVSLLVAVLAGVLVYNITTTDIDDAMLKPNQPKTEIVTS